MSIYDELLELGFLTGSRAFGTAAEDSDYDIVVSMTNIQKVMKIIEGLETTQSDYFNGFYIDTDGMKINIIPVHPDEIIPWMMATEGVKAILSKVDFEKQQKYALFQGIRSLVRMSSCAIKEES